MFKNSEYLRRGYNFIHNRAFRSGKKLSSLMIYATDLCDSGCKHCLIWAKRPVTWLPLDEIRKIMQSRCVNSGTAVGLEGGEFLLHPQANEILEWFSRHHKNFDLFSNCLQPQKLIDAVRTYPPRKLYISLDGDSETYKYMRGKDGYDRVIEVIENLKGAVPIFVMFTLSPYNDYNDLEHVASVCAKYNVFLRVGIYNNIPFFDTIDDSKSVAFGQLKNKELLTFSKAVALKTSVQSGSGGPSELHGGGSKNAGTSITSTRGDDAAQVAPFFADVPMMAAGAAQATSAVTTVAEPPSSVRAFPENFDYIKLYQNWRSGSLRLKCHSILDSLIILPNGDVPICQNLGLKLGNIYASGLDEIFNSEASVKTQTHYSENCNQCWVSYHRKYDIILYRTFEKYFGKWATSKYLGYYKWDDDPAHSYKDAIGTP